MVVTTQSGFGMRQEALNRWLTVLGYDPALASLHFAAKEMAPRHPYAPELLDLLHPEGEIRAEAVFDVEGVPTVTFFWNDGTLLRDSSRLDALRQRLWNQGLVSIALVVDESTLTPVPITPKQVAGEAMPFDSARIDGPFSRADIQSGDVRDRYQDWFRLEDRVDRKLLANLRATVTQLTNHATAHGQRTSAATAQHLVGQVLFVSYLEHRGIVGDDYRASRGVGSLLSLVCGVDRAGLEDLFHALKKDFNGDFLKRDVGDTFLWADLSDEGYSVLSDFLAATDINARQPAFFPYNFRYIPVELLSGVYESFLGATEKKQLAAYYTPRHLANLTVDQALSGSHDLLADRIYDGACGSGILLTTAFRRLLGEAEARAGAAGVSLTERIRLLGDHIYGSDISEAACRVTAFSLYLSLLERLEPRDISLLCDDEDIKLPTLDGSNLFHGSEHGDFFSPHNPMASKRDITLYLSNPPWMEIAADETLWVEQWREQRGLPKWQNQIAMYFAWRMSEMASPGARMCLILPITMLIKPRSQEFLRAWLEKVEWRRLINFGDLKELMFDGGRAACGVLLAERRQDEHADSCQSMIGERETFEYWAPKADVSLAFNRLTLHGVDRHVVSTRAIADDNRQLVTRMWGDEFDLALWAKLRLRGRFSDLFEGANRRWVKRKGFHRTDASKHAIRQASDALQGMKFVVPKMLYGTPVIDAREAVEFPAQQIPEFTGTEADLLDVFRARPKILFPDGPAPDGTVRSAYMEHAASFMSSIGVIAGDLEDEALLRFAAIYLRSRLVRYFVLTQLYQTISDRDRISLTDIAEFPFYTPERHPNPEVATRILSQLAELSRELEAVPALEREHAWKMRKDDADALVESYFGLDESTRIAIHEALDVLGEMARPYGMKSVFANAQRRVSDAQASRYALTLQTELEAWRNAAHGVGNFEIDVRLTQIERAGAFGVIRVRVGEKLRPTCNVDRSAQAVDAVIKGLVGQGLFSIEVRENIYLVADTVIVSGDTIYLIKPQSERLWLTRQAHRDAEQIVRSTLRGEFSIDEAA